MGATNIVVEGASDQYVLCELIRHFAKNHPISDFLDLNSIVVVSGGGAASIQKLLSVSQWVDEPIPATVVLVDSDAAGKEAKKCITGKGKSKRLIDEEFVICLGDYFPKHKIVTLEDFIPEPILVTSFEKYVEKWYPEEYAKSSSVFRELTQPQDKKDDKAEAIETRLNNCMAKISGGKTQELDKFGIFQEMISLLDKNALQKEDVEELRSRLSLLCQNLKKVISRSQLESRKLSGKQTIARLCKEFFIRNKNSCLVFDLILLLDRIQREIVLLGEDGEMLNTSLKRMLPHLETTRNSGQNSLESSNWKNWAQEIESLGKNPLRWPAKSGQWNKL